MIKKFEDIIAERGKLVYTNEGDSMFPIIRARDLLIIEAVREPLKVGDVPQRTVCAAPHCRNQKKQVFNEGRQPRFY